MIYILILILIGLLGYNYIDKKDIKKTLEDKETYIQDQNRKISEEQTEKTKLNIILEGRNRCIQGHKDKIHNLKEVLDKTVRASEREIDELAKDLTGEIEIREKELKEVYGVVEGYKNNPPRWLEEVEASAAIASRTKSKRIRKKHYDKIQEIVKGY